MVAALKLFLAKLKRPRVLVPVLLLTLPVGGTAGTQQPNLPKRAQSPLAQAQAEKLRAEANQDYQQHRDSEALAKYLQAYPDYAEDLEINVRIGLLYLNGPRPSPQKAISYLEKARRLQPSNLVVQSLAQAYARNGQFGPSIELYKQLVRDVPLVHNYRLDMARTLAWAGRHREAMESYGAYLERVPTDLQARIELARLLTEAKDYSRARDQYNEVLRRHPNNSPARVGLARILAWTGKIEPSLAELESVLKRDPRNFEARVLKAYDLLWLGRPEEAKKMFEALAKEAPGNSDVREGLKAVATARATPVTPPPPPAKPEALQLAEQSEAEGNHAEAIAHYREYLAEAPNDSDAQFRLALILAWNKQFGESESAFVHWLKGHPDNLEGRLQLARVFSWDHGYQQSEEEYREVLKLQPRDLQAHLELGRVLTWDHKYGEAVAQFRQAVTLKPEDPSGHLELARALSLTKEFRESEDEYRKALSLQHDSEEAQRGILQTLILGGDFTSAREELAKLEQKHPDDPEISLLREQLETQELERESRRGAAYETYLRRLVEKDPKNSKAHLELADLYLNAKDFPSAIKELQTSLNLNPQDKNLRLRLARVMSWNAQYPESLSLYREYLGRNPQDVGVELELARVLSWERNYGASLSEYQKVLKSSPQSVEARLEQGRVLTWTKRNDEAIRQFDAVLQQDPKNFDALLGKGRTYAALHKWRESVNSLDTALALRPGDPEALTAKAQALLWSGRPEAARKLLTKLRAEKPQDTAVLVSLASAENSLGRPDRALKLVNEARVIEPKNGDASSLNRQIRSGLRPELRLGWSYLRDNQTLNIWKYRALDFRFNLHPRVRNFLKVDVLPTSARANTFGYPVFTPSGTLFAPRVPVEPFIPSPTLLSQADFPSSALLVPGNQRIFQFAVQIMAGGTMRVNRWFSWTAGAGAVQLRHNPPDLESAGFPSRRTRFVYTASPTFYLGRHWQISLEASREYWTYTPKAISETTHADEQSASITWSPNPRSQIVLRGYHREIRPGFQIPDIPIFNADFTVRLGIFQGRTFKMHGNGGSVTATGTVVRREKGELVVGYEGTVFGYTHPQGIPSPDFFVNSGVFTPSFYQRHAGLVRVLVKPSKYLSWDMHGSAGPQQIRQRSDFSFSETAGSSLDVLLSPNVTLTLGYDYFSTASAVQALAQAAVRAAAYHSNNVTVGLRFRF